MLLSHALVKQQRILQQLDVLSKMASFWGEIRISYDCITTMALS